MSGSDFLPFVLLRIDEELPALHDGGTFDRLTRGRVDPAEDHVDLVLFDELRCLGLRDAVGRRAVLQVKLDRPSQQAAFGVELADHHLRNVGVGAAHESKRSGLLRDHSDFDGSVCHTHPFLQPKR